jgi:hypothetical protein
MTIQVKKPVNPSLQEHLKIDSAMHAFNNIMGSTFYVCREHFAQILSISASMDYDSIKNLSSDFSLDHNVGLIIDHLYNLY